MLVSCSGRGPGKRGALELAKCYSLSKGAEARAEWYEEIHKGHDYGKVRGWMAKNHQIWTTCSLTSIQSDIYSITTWKCHLIWASNKWCITHCEGGKGESLCGLINIKAPETDGKCTGLFISNTFSTSKFFSPFLLQVLCFTEWHLQLKVAKNSFFPCWKGLATLIWLQLAPHSVWVQTCKNIYTSLQSIENHLGVLKTVPLQMERMWEKCPQCAG